MPGAVRRRAHVGEARVRWLRAPRRSMAPRRPRRCRRRLRRRCRRRAQRVRSQRPRMPVHPRGCPSPGFRVPGHPISPLRARAQQVPRQDGGSFRAPAPAAARSSGVERSARVGRGAARAMSRYCPRGGRSRQQPTGPPAELHVGRCQGRQVSDGVPEPLRGCYAPPRRRHRRCARGVQRHGGRHRRCIRPSRSEGLDPAHGERQQVHLARRPRRTRRHGGVQARRPGPQQQPPRPRGVSASRGPPCCVSRATALRRWR
mmetsp:Transcript_9383/g.14937  ORF Transcript_9383/g.14937 Transcript_9383/m.14937 type:complete len:259 (-) Transcript_9383:3419-4195(-)